MFPKPTIFSCSPTSQVFWHDTGCKSQLHFLPTLPSIRKGHTYPCTPVYWNRHRGLRVISVTTQLPKSPMSSFFSQWKLWNLPPSCLVPNYTQPHFRTEWTPKSPMFLLWTLGAHLSRLVHLIRHGLDIQTRLAHKIMVYIQIWLVCMISHGLYPNLAGTYNHAWSIQIWLAYIIWLVCMIRHDLCPILVVCMIRHGLY